MEPSVKQAFEKLKPVCVPLTINPTPESIKRLEDVLNGLEPDDLQPLQEYVLFPLRLALRKLPSLSDKQCIGILDCTVHVLKKTAVTKWEMFQDFFNCLCLMMSSPGQDINQGSEESKLAIVNCLTALILQSDLSVLTMVYQAQFLPALGHAVSSLLALTQNERYRKLKISAIECLLSLAQAHRKGDHHLKCQVGKAFASFLPGIAIALSKIITGDVKQGQAVTVQAITAWGSLVCLVIGDKALDQDKHSSVKAKDEMLQKLIIERSEEWVKATGEKLDILIGRIVTLTSHANWKVRLAIVNWAEQLLSECQSSLKLSIPKLLEAVVALTNDDYPNVCKKSQRVLEEYKKQQTREGVKALVELLEENLHTLAMALPRVIRTGDDDEKLKSVRLLSGYLKILGPSVGSMFNSSAHLRRLCWSLMQAVELSCGDLKIMEEGTTHTGLSEDLKESFVSTIVRPKKSFKHFNDMAVFSEICMTCHYLGHYGDLTLLVDYFTEQILSSGLYRKEAILLLNEIVVGCLEEESGSLGKMETDAVLDTLGSLTEVYVSDSLFNVTTSVATSGGNLKPINMTKLTEMLDCTSITRKKDPSPTLQLINSNIQQVCLLLEGIGNVAMVLRKAFSPLLMNVLYPLLERLGDENVVISQTAYHTIQTICDSSGINSVSDLICSNVDYLINTISLKMRHFSSHSKAPLVLGVMLDHSGPELLPYLEDTIQEIFLGLDDHYVEDAFVFMRVLAKLVAAVNRWYGHNVYKRDEPSCETVNPSADSGKKSAQTFREYFLEFHRQQRIARMADSDIEDEEIPEEPTNPEEQEEEQMDIKKEPPLHVRCVTSTLDKCCHLVSSEDARLRLLVLDIICDGCAAIHNEKDELLPAAHRLWAPLVGRFQDDEPLVIIKTFETLCIMGDLCGDFLNRRVTKEILPKVADYLKKQAPVSERIGPNQKFSVAYKSQLAILKRIGKLCKELNIQAEHCETVITGCLPYLSAKQPLPLQQACLATFTALIDVDPDIVWFRLMDVSCPALPTTPHPSLRPVQFAGTSNRTAYSDNIETLLDARTLNAA